MVGVVVGPYDEKIVLEGSNPAYIPMFESNVFDESQRLVGRVQDLLGNEDAQLITLRCHLGVPPDAYAAGERMYMDPSRTIPLKQLEAQDEAQSAAAGMRAIKAAGRRERGGLTGGWSCWGGKKTKAEDHRFQRHARTMRAGRGGRHRGGGGCGEASRLRTRWANYCQVKHIDADETVGLPLGGGEGGGRGGGVYSESYTREARGEGVGAAGCMGGLGLGGREGALSRASNSWQMPRIFLWPWAAAS